MGKSKDKSSRSRQSTSQQSNGKSTSSQQPQDGNRRVRGEEKLLADMGYTLGVKMGEGAHSKVYEASYAAPGIRRQLACKVVDTSKLGGHFIQKFLPREIQILETLNNPNIIQSHSILFFNHKYFLFMTFCPNGDLLNFVKNHGAVREGRARRWFLQLLDGVSYLHDHKIAHRDIKCENILINNGFNLKIADFGFARYVDMKNNELSKTYCGSLAYAAPEVIKGEAYIPKLVDLWALGVVLFVMLTKSMPFDGEDQKAVYYAQINRDYSIRASARKYITNEAVNFLYKLLEPDPKKRYFISHLRTDKWFEVTGLSETQLPTLEGAGGSLKRSPALGPSPGSSKQGDSNRRSLPPASSNEKILEIQKPSEFFQTSL